MELNLAYEIAPMFHKDFFNFYDYEIKDGGRGSTKTNYFATKLLVSPFGILHEKDIAYVVMRKFGNKIRRSIFNEFIKVIRRLGFKLSDFKIRYSPMEITHIKNNTSIYFSGIDNIDDIKGFTSSTQKIIGVLFEEMTEIGKTLEEIEDIINSIIATFSRGTDMFSFMGTFNPPKMKLAPINQWLAKYKGIINHMRTNIYMLPDSYINDWKLKEMLKQAENLKAIDIDLWKNVYMAEEITPQMATYPNYREENIMKPIELQQYSKINIGVDTGSSVGANVFIASGIVGFFEEVHVIKEFYHQNKTMGFLNSQDRIDKFFEFCHHIFHTYKILPTAYIESADVQFYKDLLLRQKQFNLGTVKINLVNKKQRLNKSSSPIEERIELETKLIGSKRLTIDKKCGNLNRAFQLSERDNNGNRIDDEAHPVDALDAFEYSLLDDLIQLNNNILAKGVKEC